MTRAQVGDAIPSLTLPPLSRGTLALYAGGSGDHVPLHIDAAFAKGAGYPDVFMHGMLGSAYVVRALTEWVSQDAVHDLQVRFVAITYPEEVLTATGVVAEVGVDGVPNRCRVDLELRNSAGERKLAGFAIIDHPT
ncbi:MAG: dehydratase [Gemmatimonadetes bacterium]|nr:dehydratase [Gemmatimonadota bacterium]